MDRWGTYPEWLAAFGTIGAVWFAVVTVRRESDHRRQEVEDRRWHQANRVSGEFDADFDHAALYVTVTNNGDRPIFDLAGEVYDVAGNKVDATRDPATYELPPRAVLLPGDQRRQTYQQPQRRHTRSEWSLRLHFTDYDGVAWTREADHRLTRHGQGLRRRWWWPFPSTQQPTLDV